MSAPIRHNPSDPHCSPDFAVSGRPSWMDAGLDSPSWLYGFGDWERHRLLKMRETAFALVTDMFHPGLFRAPASCRYFRRFARYDAKPFSAPAIFYHSGDFFLRVNGRLVASHPATPRPVGRSIDLAPYLREGDNLVLAVVLRREEPPACFAGYNVPGDARDWETSDDWQRWDKPERYAFTDPNIFPHQEVLPTLRVQPRRRKGLFYDFGSLFLARPVLWARGQGQVTIYPGESADEAEADGSTQEASAKAREERVVFSLGREAEAPGVEVPMGPVAARYLRVEPSDSVMVDSVALEVEAYPVRYNGWFSSSDHQLQSIWQAAAYTLRLCMREFFIDGIKRDRLPWAGDLAVALDGNAHVFADSGINRRTLTALAPADPARAPVNGIDDYTFHWIIALHRHWLYTADVDYIRRLWPTLKETMSVLGAPEHLDPSGRYLPYPDGWVFIDWAEQSPAERDLALQMLHVQAVRAAAQLARALEMPAAADAWNERAAKAADHLRNHAWNDAVGLYSPPPAADGEAATDGKRHAGFLSVLSGVATPEQTERIAKTALSDNRLPPVGTPYMKYFELAALAESGRRAVMLDAVRTYWSGMLVHGNTFWEAWQPGESGKEKWSFYGRPFGRSLCHAWSAGPLSLLSGALIGLRPLEAGWKRFELDETLPVACHLDWLEIRVPTPHGVIGVESRAGSLVLTDQPKNCQCVRRPLRG